MVELALAFTDKDGSYAEHAAVVLTSVFLHTGSQVNVHILHDESLTEENKLRIKQLVSHYNHTVNFYSVVFPPDLAEVVEGAQSVNTWTRGSMYRLLLPFLPNIGKVIYLDCDVLVNLDIQELWNIDLNGYYLAAARDPGVAGLTDILLPLGLNPDNYFNSGVIVFGLDNIRHNPEWYDKMKDFLREHPSTTLPDQDILNHVFGSNYLQLGGEFNTFSFSNPDQDFNHKIVHFAGETKWWDPASPGYALYEEYLNLTPWRLPESHFAAPLEKKADPWPSLPRLEHEEPAQPEGSAQLPLQHAGKQQPVHKVNPPRHRRIYGMKKTRMKRQSRLKKSRRLAKQKLLKRPVRQAGFGTLKPSRPYQAAPLQRNYRLKPKRRTQNFYPGIVTTPGRGQRVAAPRRRMITELVGRRYTPEP
ncbi:glycosyltransferase [Paenibacillus woosongensis]|uniref:Glycosyltransferase family 8 protein n=1 Tax=Paenibacillus woosongensis TaxID=307580 RepID=A0ABQ4MXE2_9BACL|nr:glycosyltransferase [Paenibacillus woosongensis]GIP60573.1 hypothetical protein J15TS10_43870 [Paenibacillus woosongensis]